jgi:hypothetical protein
MKPRKFWSWPSWIEWMGIVFLGGLIWGTVGGGYLLGIIGEDQKHSTADDRYYFLSLD